jgi:hypothetical protein
METTHEPNLLRVNYVFEASLERVFQMIKDPVSFTEVYSPFLTNLECLSGENIFTDVGAEFKYTWKNNLTIYFKIKAVVDELNYKMINSHYHAVEPTKFQYNIIFKLYPVSTQMKTIMSLEVEFDSQDALNFYMLALNDSEKLSCLKNKENFLLKQLDLKQEESVILPVNIKKVWDIVTDWKVFKKHVPDLAEEIEYEYDKDNVVEFVRLKLSKEKEQCLKVVKKEFGEQEGIYMLTIDDNNSPTQEVILNLIFIDNSKCLLVFRHNFLVPVRYKSIQTLSENKKAILKTLKKSLKENKIV